MNFAAGVVRPGRAFTRRLISLAYGLKKPSHRARLTKPAILDLKLWKEFLYRFHGKALFQYSPLVLSIHSSLITDTSGAIGYGGYWGPRWFQGNWAEGWDTHPCLSIAFEELFPIYLTFHIFKRERTNHTISIRSDNQSVVHILKSCSSKDSNIMCLVRSIVLICMEFNILFTISQISGLSLFNR